MPPDSIPDPNNPVLSRDLYDQILHYATIPVLLFLIWLSWFIINRLMSPEARQARRNREIRRAVAERKALQEAEEAKQAASDGSDRA
ncbi:MAG TPA: hypothetical protein VKU00_27225 [Chthonomonadaceae bacterium]|nr:hypothetical protein [Chthonomonadaceae bacterium]